jgi:hypothetical protein
MFADLFKVRADEIEDLDEKLFVDLCNSLIRHDGRRLGVPPEKLLTTLRITDPDGGIDALTDTGDGSTNYLPTGQQVWQYKITYPSSLPELEADLRKSKPAQNAFAEGAGYILMVGVGMTPSLIKSRHASLVSSLRNVGCKADVRLRSADHVSDWTSHVPGALLSVHPELGEYVRADVILKDQRHAVPFQPDAARGGIIEALRGVLIGHEAISWHARVEGPAGVGKTRVVLEALNEVGIVDVTLYARGVPSSALLSRAVQEEGLEISLVVDECDGPQAEALELLTRSSHGRVRLVTIGVGRGTGESTYSLQPLDPSSMEAFLERATPGLGREQRAWIAEKTGGYVKLAVAVARGVVQGQVSIDELRTSREVRDVVNRLVIADEDTRLAITGVALLRKMGREGDLEIEGKVVSDFIGLDWSRMQGLLTRPIADGLVVPKGRYLYVSPELLAMWLAAEYWEANSHRISQLMGSLPPPAVESFLERLAGLRGVPGVQEVVEEVVGPEGPFDTPGSLWEEREAKAFYTLSEAAPRAALETLEHLITQANESQLRAWARGRRYGVWTLERLVARREFFDEAARLLRRLAVFENENYANSATGLFTGLFLVALAPTEAPFQDRLPILIETVSNDRPEEERLLGVACLGRALETSEIGYPIGGGGSLPPVAWRPATWDEVRALKKLALGIFDDLVADSNASVRHAVIQEFLKHSRGLVRLGLRDDVIRRIASLPAETRDQERLIWNTTTGVLKYDRKWLDADHIEQLQAIRNRIFSSSLEDQVRRYTGPFSITDWDQEDEPQEGKAAVLADRLFEDRETLERMLDWLVSEDAQQVWPLGVQLGVRDNSRELFATLLDAARRGPNARVLSGYMSGRDASGDADWVNAVLDSWASDDALARLAFDASIMGRGTDRAVARLLRIVDGGRVDSTWLSWARFGRWGDALSESATRALVARLLESGDIHSVEAALAIVHQRIASSGTGFREFAAACLANPVTWQRETMISWLWSEIGKALVSDDPTGIADVVAQAYLQGDSSFNDSRLEVLESALTIAPRDVMAVLSVRMRDSGNAYKLAWELESNNVLANLPIDAIRGMVSEGDATGARLAAQSFKPEPGQGDDLLRFLLEHFYAQTESLLAANFLSGGWTGPESGMISTKLQQAEIWQSYPSPAVRQWAAKLAKGLRADLKRALLEEEERGY